MMLRDAIVACGGTPAEGSGAWGTFAKVVEGGAKVFGEKAAVAALEEGEDHGLADYNTMRAAYGLRRVRSFAEITSDRELQRKLRDLYGSVNNIDAFVGGLAEGHAAGSSVGPLFRRIIADQFERLRDGDSFWYQRIFSGRELAAL